MSDLTHAFIIDRASKSTAVAVTFTSLWTWDEKTPAQHDALRVGVEAAEAAAGTLEAAMLQARANLDNALDQFHTWTVQGLGMARVRVRGDAGKAATLSTLKAGGNSRLATREEGRNWLNWWSQFDPAWVPMPGLTLAAFSALRVQIEGVDNPAGVSTAGLVDLYDRAHDLWRAQAETTNGLARALEDVNEAWYEAATTVFAAGTPQGDLIRGQVPTTYTGGGGSTPPPPPPPPPPLALPTAPQNVVLTTGDPGSGAAGLSWDELPVAQAITGYHVYRDGVFHMAAGTPTTLDGFPPGEALSITVAGINATGEGPQSDPATGTAG